MFPCFSRYGPLSSGFPPNTSTTSSYHLVGSPGGGFLRVCSRMRVARAPTSVEGGGRGLLHAPACGPRDVGVNSEAPLNIIGSTTLNRMLFKALRLFWRRSRLVVWSRTP